MHHFLLQYGGTTMKILGYLVQFMLYKWINYILKIEKGLCRLSSLIKSPSLLLSMVWAWSRKSRGERYAWDE